MSRDRVEALRRECDEVMRFCGQLNDEEWQRPSACEGWSVQDVMAHISSSFRLLSLSALKLVFTNDIERTNEAPVDARRGWSPDEVLAEYERYRSLVLRVTATATRTPLGRMRVRAGEMGWFPLHKALGCGLVFDQHIHLRHDMAPALDQLAPDTDQQRMVGVLTWMFAVLSNQLRSAGNSWRDRPLAITLEGPGGGTWRIGGNGRITPAATADGLTQIRGSALQFPSWGTCRSPWREHDIEITGDEEYAARILDAVNII